MGKNQKVKGNREKNIVGVKCYNCSKKDHYAQDCPQLPMVALCTHIPELYIFSHALVADFLIALQTSE